MSKAWGRGLTTVADDGAVLDAWFPELGIGEMTSPRHDLRAGERRDDVRGVDVRFGIHPVAGRMQAVGLPIKFSHTPGARPAAAPVYGEHSGQILAEAGYGPAEIEEIFNTGVAVAPSKPKRSA